MNQGKEFEPKHLDYIDTLRGLAFLGVLCKHAVGCVGPFALWDWFGGGFYGVQLFFLASAITLCASASRRVQIDRYPWLSFFLRRLFRIGPLFWLAMVFYWTCPGTWPEFMHQTDATAGIRPYHFVLTALFLHGLRPETINSIVPGGWSIAVEMTFYAFFPLLFYLINSLRKAAVAILLSLVFGRLVLSFLMPFLHPYLYGYSPQAEYDFFSLQCFPAQAPVFIIGFGIYYFLKSDPGSRLTRSRFWSNALFLFCFTAFPSILSDPPGFIPPRLVAVILLAGLVIAISSNSIPGLVNPVLCYIGKVSYSCYIVHFAALVLALRLWGLGTDIHVHDAGSSLQNLILFVKIISATFVLTLIGATATLYLVEKPGIALGRRVIQWCNSR